MNQIHRSFYRFCMQSLKQEFKELWNKKAELLKTLPFYILKLILKF